ncbi:MAG: NUDIX domain-containing protein [Candidatus Caenarcaniphilales bacterium]|nr:NUDIX domain-containing protein [Candidatus Caenarcaniphilales bacterium]
MIKFCPRCGKKSFSRSKSHNQPENQVKDFKCSECNFQYFHNTAATVGAAIKYKDKILLTSRAYNPGKGMLDLPGGFVDYNESLEDALRREIEEELGITNLGDMKYLFSFPNSYDYADITYRTLDSFFAINLKEEPQMNLSDEISDVSWMNLDKINLEEVAFDSIKNAIVAIRNKQISPISQ